jgi:hypothetical protein
MHLSKVFAVFTIAFTTETLAAPVAEALAVDTALPFEHIKIVARGFGCPLSRQQCNDHVSEYRESFIQTYTLTNIHSVSLSREEGLEDTVLVYCDCKQRHSFSSSYDLLTQ